MAKQKPYENPWTFNGEPFTEDAIDKFYGFVYSIVCPDGRQYIGRKAFWHYKRKPGKKRRERVMSDWKTYYGSHKGLQEQVKQNGSTGYQRIILSLHLTKGDANMNEVREQFRRNVLEDDSYINENINGKWYRTKSHIKEGRLINEKVDETISSNIQKCSKS